MASPSSSPVASAWTSESRKCLVRIWRRLYFIACVFIVTVTAAVCVLGVVRVSVRCPLRLALPHGGETLRMIFCQCSRGLADVSDESDSVISIINSCIMKFRLFAHCRASEVPETSGALPWTIYYIAHKKIVKNVPQLVLIYS